MAIGLLCAAKNMLKVTHKYELSNRGTKRLFLWYFAGLALALLAWVARTDPATNYLPCHE